jgi:hypothetical protein
MSTTHTKTTTEPVETLEQTFHRLEAEWDADTAVLSNPNKIMGHPAMRAIVALGEPVVPLILRELQAGPSLLVWALPEIVGAHPEFEGNVSTMTNAWLGVISCPQPDMLIGGK